MKNTLIFILCLYINNLYSQLSVNKQALKREFKILTGIHKNLQQIKKVTDTTELQTVYFKLAQNYALIQKHDSAFFFLSKITNLKEYWFPILSEPLFYQIRSKPQFENYLNTALKFQRKSYPEIISEYFFTLYDLYVNNQKYRTPEISAIYRYDKKSELFDKELKRQDSLNIAKLEYLISKYGYPFRKFAGFNPDVFLLIVQYADLKIQKKYIDIIFEMAKKGELSLPAFASLKDKMLLKETGFQLYGTQFKKNYKTGKRELYPLKDEEHIDSLRNSVEIESIDDFVKQANISYGHKTYKNKKHGKIIEDLIPFFVPRWQKGELKSPPYLKNNLVNFYQYNAYCHLAQIAHIKGIDSTKKYALEFLSRIISIKNNEGILTSGFYVIQYKLSKKMIAGKDYTIEFNYSSENINILPANDICLGFTNYDYIGILDSLTKERKQPVHNIIKSNYFKKLKSIFENPVKIPSNELLKYTLNYKAKGDEQFFLIENQPVNIIVEESGESSNTTKKIKRVFHIRKVSIIVTDSVSFKNPKELLKNEVIVLENVLFNYDKSELQEESFFELDELYKYLLKYSTIKIEISGHTDNTGEENHNLALSEARAKAVADYLISKGIDAKRITYKGYGSTKPKTTNDTPDNRAINRRVEFMIIEK